MVIWYCIEEVFWLTYEQRDLPREQVEVPDQETSHEQRVLYRQLLIRIKIMTKSKNSIVTRNDTSLGTCMLPVAVIKITFPLLALVRYLLLFNIVNSYVTRCSWENLIFYTASGNVSGISYGVSLASILLYSFTHFH